MNAGKMMDILDIPMNAGGATWPAGEKIQTVYQVIAIPGELKLWVKVPGFQNWTGVDLANDFGFIKTSEIVSEVKKSK